jgi:hypothetical protein
MLISIEETLYKSHFLYYKYFRGFVGQIYLKQFLYLTKGKRWKKIPKN